MSNNNQGGSSFQEVQLWILNYFQELGDFRHWAFFIGESLNGDGTLYHVSRYRGSEGLVYSAEEKRDPEGSRTHRETRFICEFESQSKLDKAVAVFEETAIPNAADERNCQDWCLEVLKTLEKRKLIPRGSADEIDDDEDFLKKDDSDSEGEENDRYDSDDDDTYTGGNTTEGEEEDSE